MPFIRTQVTNGAGLPRPARPGDGWCTFVAPVVIATDAATTLTAAQVTAAGVIQFTGFTVSRAITTPTAVQIIADNAEMDIGDSFILMISIVPAFVATFVAGTGVTITGRTAGIPGASVGICVITRTGAATIDWRIL
jgi:hypothetical protein